MTTHQQSSTASRGIDRRTAMAGMTALTLGGLTGPAAAQTTRGVTATKITVGTMQGLTGPTAVAGEQMRAGVESYFRMINDRGGVNGRTIELVAEDNEWSAQKAVAAARKMVLRDNIFALLAANGTAQINPVLPLLEENGVPVINAFTSVLDWFTPVKRHIYGVYTPLEYSYRACGRWAAKDGAKKILVPYFDAAWNKDMASAEVPIGAKSVSAGVQVEYMPIKLGTVDYVPHVLEIIRRKPDAVIGGVIVGEFTTLVREMRTQGSKIPIYTGSWNLYDSLVAGAPQQFEGVKGLAFTTSPLGGAPAIKEYRDALAKYFPSQKPDYVSLFTFAGAKVFTEAVSRVKGEFTLQAFYNAMNSLKNYDTGILPPVTFSPENHQGNTSLFKVVAHDGHWKPTGEVIDAVKNAW